MLILILPLCFPFLLVRRIQYKIQYSTTVIRALFSNQFSVPTNSAPEIDKRNPVHAKIERKNNHITFSDSFIGPWKSMAKFGK